MIGNSSLYHPKKLKLLQNDWNTLKSYCFDMAIHHELGKEYESLCCLRVMKHEEHSNGFNHHKYIHGIPYARVALNLAYWVQILGDDFEYFAENNLLGI